MKIVLFTLWSGLVFLIDGSGLRFFRAMENRAVPALSLPAEIRGSAAGGAISGRVTAGSTAGSEPRSSRGLYGRSTSRLSKAKVDKRAVVFINKASGYFTPPQSHPAMRQKNVAIVPRVLPVLAGTTVDFPNEDEIFHNIFSLSATKTFDLGRYAKGRSKSVKFDKTGTVKVFCDIHSQMSGTVLVLQNPFFAVVDENGQYSIKGVPPGRYEISAWHEDSGLKTSSVSITEGQQSAVDFVF